MRCSYKPETSLFYRILIFLAVLFTGLIITYAVFLIVVYATSGFNFAMTNEKLATLNDNVHLLRIIQTLQSFFVFIFPPFILAKLFKENSTDFIQLKMPGIQFAIFGIISIILMIPLINFLVEWNAGLHLPESMQGLESWMRTSEDTAEKVTTTMLNGSSWWTLIVNLIIISALAGIGEEFLFRGTLQSIFSKGLWPNTSSGKMPDWVMHTTIWLVAFLFSAIHMQFYGFIPRLLLGAWFGYLLWWSGSIWVPVLAHFTNNAVSTIAVFLQNKGLITEDPDQIGLNSTWWLCLVSILLLVGGAFYMTRKKDTDHNLPIV